MTMQTIVGYSGAFLGLLGTLLLAFKGSRWAGFGFIAYLASNLGWIWYAFALDLTPLLLQHVAFACTSALGIWIWLVRAGREISDRALYEAAREDLLIWKRRALEAEHQLREQPALRAAARLADDPAAAARRAIVRAASTSEGQAA